MENGEKVIRMLCHMTIGLQYRSHKCTPSWASKMRRNIQYRGDREISEETLDKVERPLTNTPPRARCVCTALHVHVQHMMTKACSCYQVSPIKQMIFMGITRPEFGLKPT